MLGINARKQITKEKVSALLVDSNLPVCVLNSIIQDIAAELKEVEKKAIQLEKEQYQKELQEKEAQEKSIEKIEGEEVDG